MRPRIALLMAVLLLSAPALAATLNGTVTNGTVRKPAAGDDVVLLELSQGMNEAARTQTDARGRYRFEVANPSVPHLVRVNHQGVNYHKMAPPGSSTADLEVFDVAKKVEGISASVNIIRFQAQGSTLEVTELFSVRNVSDPPRTQMSDQAFEIFLPEGAQIDQSLAAGPGGQPVTSAPVPTGEKGRYAFIFPLRPGETRFQLSYHLPYSGEFSYQPRSLVPMEHLVVMVPGSMQFTAAEAARFQPMPDESGAKVHVATQAGTGKGLEFKISGTGVIQEGQESAAAAGQQEGMRAGPGGGLGKPIQTPDPLYNYRWFILGGLAVVLAGGAFYVWTRPAPALAGNLTAAAGYAPVALPRQPAAAAASAAAPAAAPRTGVFEALKEELFQLELDRHQGRISAEEYDKARAALDLMLQRAAARQK